MSVNVMTSQSFVGEKLHCNYSFDSDVLLSCFMLVNSWSAEQWRRFVAAGNSARHTHFADHHRGNLDCIRPTPTAPQYCVESMWFHLFSGLISLSLLCPGPHQTTRLKIWCSWSWATLIPTFSCWWDSWKDSTARWTSTRTPSEYSCCCCTAHPRWCLQHVQSMCVTCFN